MLRKFLLKIASDQIRYREIRREYRRKNRSNRPHRPRERRPSVLELVTPKQVARAIDVSESSVKRWCDRGIMATVKTAGGHRRIPISAVIAYVQSVGCQVICPEVLGLPATSGKTNWVVDRARNALKAALLAGEEELSRQIVFDFVLSGKPIPQVCDALIAGALQDIGNAWACHTADVYHERRACEIIVRILYELRTATPLGDPHWRAIGGTIPGDQYVLPTTMVELILQTAGWNARSLGNSVPYESFALAIRESSPRIFWLSVSYIRDEQEFVSGMGQINAAADAIGSTIVIGGFALTEPLRSKIQHTVFSPSMVHLADFAEKFRGKPSQ